MSPVFIKDYAVLGDFPSIYRETNEYERRDRTMTEFEQMQIEQLKRIADSLEHIDGLLTGCVGYVPPRQGYVQSEGYSFLRIGGSVDTEY